MNRPQVVSRSEWLAARRALLTKEKESTRQRDALSAERRKLPMVRVEKEYVFDGPNGRTNLRDLFGNHPQLLIYHFMFDPSWDEGCKSCSFFADNFPGSLSHFAARNTAFAVISRAPSPRSMHSRSAWVGPSPGSHRQATASTTTSMSHWTNPLMATNITTRKRQPSSRQARFGLRRASYPA